MLTSTTPPQVPLEASKGIVVSLKYLSNIPDKSPLGMLSGISGIEPPIRTGAGPTKSNN